MSGNRCLISSNMIGCEISSLIDSKTPPYFFTKQTYNNETDTCCFEVEVQGVCGAFEFPTIDLALSFDEFSSKHIAPYVNRVHVPQAEVTA